MDVGFTSAVTVTPGERARFSEAGRVTSPRCARRKPGEARGTVDAKVRLLSQPGRSCSDQEKVFRRQVHRYACQSRPDAEPAHYPLAHTNLDGDGAAVRAEQ